MICLKVNTMTSNMMNDGAACTIVKKEEGDDERCRFMEAVIDHKQFPETDIALQAGTMLLNIFEYIKVVNYQIDQFMVNRFWQSMSAKNSCILVDAAVLEWLGYDHDQERNRKASFLKLLKANTITHKQIKHTDDDFNQYSEAVEEAKIAFIYHAPTGIQFTEENGPDDLIRLINDLHEVRMEYPEQAVSSDSE